MATNLKMVSKEIIRPSSPTPENLKLYQFSFLDQVQHPAYISFIFFYQKTFSPNTSGEDESRCISQRLKQSLSDALTKYYLLAGRILGNLFVDCNDSGAIFVEARVDGNTFLFQDLIETAPVEELCKSYLPLAHFTDVDYSIPLAVQVSFFPCGRVAIGAQMSHQVGDVISFVTFLNSWAAICRGDFEMMQPDFDSRLHNFPSIQLPKPPAKETIDDLKKQKIVTKRILFDREKLAVLKAFASSSPAGSKPMENLTRVEALSAFICKKLVDITRTKANPKKFFAILHVVNLRPRLIRPPQQQHDDELENQFLFGNFSSISASTLMMSENNAPEFSDITRAVQSATRKFNNDNEENIRSKVIDANRQHLANFGNRDFEYCYFTSRCKFPFDQVDYGWGKPCSVRTTVLPYKNTVILMDSRNGDGIEALVNLAEEDLAMLPNIEI